MATDNKQILSLPPKLARLESQEQAQVLVSWLKTKVKGFRIYFTPDIPPHKRETVRKVCQLPDGERLLALVDVTILGSAKECLAITGAAVYYKWAILDKPIVVDFPTFLEYEIKVENNEIKVGPDISFHPSWADETSVIGLLKTLQQVLRNGIAVTEEELKKQPKAGYYFDWIRGLGVGIPLCLFFYIKTMLTTAHTSPKQPEFIVLAIIVAVVGFGVRKKSI